MGDEMTAAIAEPRTMGRPKKQTPTVSMRINEDVHDLARQACSFTKESIVDYVSRVVRERAAIDV